MSVSVLVWHRATEQPNGPRYFAGYSSVTEREDITALLHRRPRDPEAFEKLLPTLTNYAGVRRAWSAAGNQDAGQPWFMSCI
jgi:hypothetical protein